MMLDMAKFKEDNKIQQAQLLIQQDLHQVSVDTEFPDFADMGDDGPMDFRELLGRSGIGPITSEV